jgi:pimeloyl-ACP methyl ester carboxylesterase
MTDATPSSLVIPAGGGVLSYLEAGSGPLLVLLHGIGSAAVSFCHQLDGSSADFRVIAGHALYLEKPQAFNRLVRDLAMQHTGSIGIGDPID